MRPYEKLIGARQLAGVMLAHIVYSELDPVPASFSPYWIQNQLRQQLGFDGAVFCDDLSMKATKKFGSMAKRARLVMSHALGKIDVLAQTDDHIYMKFHRARYREDEGRFMIFYRNDKASWLDDLIPSDHQPHPVNERRGDHLTPRVCAVAR